MNLKNNQSYILDTSFIRTKNGSGLCEILYRGESALNEVHMENIEFGLERINFVNQIASENSLIVISEALIEMQERNRILNTQINYLRNGIKQGKKR